MERVDTAMDGAKRFDRDSRTCVVRRDETDDAQLSYHVLDAVSAVTQRPIEELRPFYEAVDPDALEALFEWGDDSGSPEANGVVTFQYEGCDVTIRTDGQTIVSRRDEPQL